ncbi:MAG: division/cell wall cluster transcriptional repressor MraZ [Gammaproteobacteria bacterium]|nr:division/cell wall cluster transcriptional repressor MraZ [Gammaproteobacteria bacterium]
MFRGVSALSLDDKGRLAIPTKYRDALGSCGGGHLVATVAQNDRCLWLYPLPEWEEIERKLVALPSMDKASQRLKRILMGHATDTDLDGNGRILLSAPLRDFAKLEKHAVLIGQGNKFEIWDENLWNQRCEEWLSEEFDGSGDSVLPVELETLSL